MLFSRFTGRYVGSVVSFPSDALILATLKGRGSEGIWYTREVTLVCPD